MGSEYRPEIDGLRAIAVLAVIGFHVGVIPGGFVGVDIFFVISGYLISRIVFVGVAKEPPQAFLVRFYAGRVRRIFPALAVVLTACLVIGWFTLLPDELIRLGKHVLAGSAFISNFLLMGEVGYFDTAAKLKPLLHLWSLGIEEQFYLLWPVIAIVALRRHVSIVPTTLVLIAASFALDLVYVNNWPVGAFYLPVTRLWELMFGAWLAARQMRRGAVGDGGSMRDAASLLGGVLIAWASFGLKRSQAWPAMFALVPTVGTLLIISAGPNAWFNRRVLSLQTCVALGLISYPLYLWHWPLLSFVRIVESGDPDPWLVALAVVLAFPLAWLTYEFVERPIRFGRLPSSLRVAGPVAAVVLVGAIGAAVFASDGLPSRLPRYETTRKGPWSAAQRDCAQMLPTLTPDDVCRQTAEQDAAPVDVIIGDSHAGSLARGLEIISTQKFGARNLFIVSRAGCPALSDVARWEYAIRRTCDLDAELRKLAGARGINNLILASRWAFYAAADGFGDDAGVKGGINPGYLHIQPADEQRRIDEPDYAAVLAGGLDHTLHKLSGKAQRIVFVHQVPEIGFNPQSCIDSRPLRLTHHVRYPCAVSRADAEARRRLYAPAVDRVLEKFPDVGVIDPMPILCDASWCHALEGTELLYLDNNHVSAFGAALVLKRILPMLAPAQLSGQAAMGSAHIAP